MLKGSVVLTGSGGTFRSWNLVEGDQVTRVMPLKEFLGFQLLPVPLNLLHSHHEVNRSSLPCAPATMYSASTGLKQQDQQTMDSNHEPK